MHKPRSRANSENSGEIAQVPARTADTAGVGGPADRPGGAAQYAGRCGPTPFLRVPARPPPPPSRRRPRRSGHSATRSACRTAGRRRSARRTPRTVRTCRRRGGRGPFHLVEEPVDRVDGSAVLLVLGDDLPVGRGPAVAPRRPRSPRPGRRRRRRRRQRGPRTCPAPSGDHGADAGVPALSSAPVDHSVCMPGAYPRPGGHPVGWPGGVHRPDDRPRSPDASPRWPSWWAPGQAVPCLGGIERRAVELDQAASTQAHPAVAERVTEFLPWYSSVHRGAGLPVAAGHPRLRGGPPGRPGLRRPRPGRARRRHPVPQHHRGHQPPRLPAAARPDRRGRHHRGRAPRQPAALGPGGASAATSSAATDGTFTVDDVVAALDARRAPSGAAGGHRRLQRVRVAAAPRRRSSTPPTSGACRSWSTRAQLAPHRPLPADGRLRGLQRPQALRPLRVRVPSSDPGTCSRPATRSWPAAAPSTSSASTR